MQLRERDVVGAINAAGDRGVRTALFQAAHTGKSVEARRVRLERDGRSYYVNMVVRPFRDNEAGSDYMLVLFDEVEKAHPDVMELFYQVFDKGVLEDGEGREIDFKNCIILLTSNVGSELIMTVAPLSTRKRRNESACLRN